ncbi:MAG: GTPase HflX [bacterium]
MEGFIIKKIKNKKPDEKAVLVGYDKNSLDELEGLTSTAGVKVETRLLHRNENINPAYYIGNGKLHELKQIISSNMIDVVIFDNELTPAQFRNIEESLETKVIDRTQLILDIFALHAQTKESKLQVELAQLEYLLPKLSGKGEKMSRLAGGIGTRGPGETKLEVDRRRIKNRIHKLKLKLKNIKQNRQIQRNHRNDPLIALIGYTNAGKSTLMNLLTNADTIVADKLFATLDSTLRKAYLPIGRKVIFTDTVGFIRKLPLQLVASFSATLEEIENANILLHVVDSSQNNYKNQIKTVNQLLDTMNITDKKQILVFNKVDSINKEKLLELELTYPDSIMISAKNGYGKSNLINQISQIIKKEMKLVDIKLPYEKLNLLDKIYQGGKVYNEEYLNNRIKVKARVTKPLAGKLKKYIFTN